MLWFDPSLLIEGLYIELLGSIERGELVRTNILWWNCAPFFHTWVCIPLSVEQPLMLIPKLAFVLWDFLDMEDWSGGGSSGGLNFSISTKCRQRLSFVSMFTFNRNIHFSSIICVTINICIDRCGCFDYITTEFQPKIRLLACLKFNTFLSNFWHIHFFLLSMA